MKRHLYFILCTLVITVLAGFLVFAVIYDKTPGRAYRDAARRSYRVFVPECPKHAEFAGEKMPLELFYVKESLDREILINTFMHASTIMMFKRANRWFPVIEPILKQNKVPEDFKFLAVAESNLINAVSPARAEGFWQFMKPTAIKYGLEINDEVDERYNVVKSTEAACAYFLNAYEKFGSWTLAAAAFNRGEDGMDDILDHQKSGNFYELYLNDETTRYIYRIVALKEIYSHPVNYGFYLRTEDFYPSLPVNVIEVDSSISDLSFFAVQNKVSYKVLRDFNPWLKRYTLTNKTGKTYRILLPKDGELKAEPWKSQVPSETYFHDTLKINEIH